MITRGSFFRITMFKKKYLTIKGVFDKLSFVVATSDLILEN